MILIPMKRKMRHMFPGRRLWIFYPGCPATGIKFSQALSACHGDPSLPDGRCLRSASVRGLISGIYAVLLGTNQYTEPQKGVIPDSLVLRTLCQFANMIQAGALS